ncbi:MAG: GHMP kinase [Phycisphaerae bacterium]
MIITKAPLRISFLGGGTDYPAFFRHGSGAVLGAAIDKAISISAFRFYSELHDYRLRISYSRNELVHGLDDIQHTPFRECLRHCGIERDIELSSNADLPAFTGLGSSSTFVVALLQALHAFRGQLLQGMELAYRAIQIERGVLKENVGLQDQTFAAVGGLNLVEFRAEDDIVVHRLPLSHERRDELQRCLLLVFTQVKRKAEEVIARQLARVDDNAERLVRMRTHVDEGFRILTGSGTLAPFGELLHRAWVEKRSLDSAVSNERIDQLYQRGRDAGALGGKLLGAGGGGFLLFFVPPERRAAVSAALSQFPQVPVRIGSPGSRIIHAD